MTGIPLGGVYPGAALRLGGRYAGMGSLLAGEYPGARPRPGGGYLRSGGGYPGMPLSAGDTGWPSGGRKAGTRPPWLTGGYPGIGPGFRLAGFPRSDACVPFIPVSA